MTELMSALASLGTSLWDLLLALLGIVVPWTPLAAWVVFWLLAVNWIRLRETFARGGWIGVALIGAVAVLIWGSLAPSVGGQDFFGLTISNYVEKTVYVSGLACLMFLAGALQLSGFCSSLCRFEEPILIADTHGHDPHDSHAPHGGHGHDAHSTHA